MSKTVTFQQRIQQLRELEADLPEILGRAAEEAAKRAVQAAAAATPPKEGSGRGSAYSGTHTLTGELKAHWATDSRTQPVGGGFTSGGEFHTKLANNMEYASYVNDGHRMHRHFVPGLHVNPYSGLLEYDPAADVGIVVGTKTKYVKGEYMADKGIEEYQKAVREILDKVIEEAMKK
ncbi:MAG: HK97 gp10 family phage protein [Clostridiales bacterium]|nr:HK97 gp10 family phage protein [Clostridiales bacterium]